MKRARRRWLTGLLAVGLAALLVPHVAASNPDDYQQSTLFFESHGKRIRVDCFEFAANAPDHLPTGDDRSATRDVLVLHGAGGVIFDGPEMRRIGRAFATQGIRAYVVHYFDGSGIVATRSIRTLNEHFNEWQDVVRDAVVFAQSRENPPGNRPVAIYGYSMGAFLGLAASSDNARVGALVEQAGGVWDNDTGRLHRMPPVLMIHGRADERVPFNKFVPPLQRALRERGAPVETLFIDGEGHGFSPAAQANARRAAVDFVQRRLPPQKVGFRTKKPDR